MPFCSILTCKNDSRTVNLTKGGITYHRFPHDPKLRDTWIEATGKVNWKPKKCSTICSTHFDDKYFMVNEKQRKRICRHAVPTLNVLSFHPKMQVVTFEKLDEPLQQEYKPKLLEILTEQGMDHGNVSLMVPLKPPDDDDDDEDEEKDEDDKVDDSELTERERRFKAKLRWTKEEIMRQKKIIKSHETQIYKLKMKRLETKKLLDQLQDKFAMPIQEIVKIDLRNP